MFTCKWEATKSGAEWSWKQPAPRCTLWLINFLKLISPVRRLQNYGQSYGLWKGLSALVDIKTRKRGCLLSELQDDLKRGALEKDVLLSCWSEISRNIKQQPSLHWMFWINKCWCFFTYFHTFSFTIDIHYFISTDNTNLLHTVQKLVAWLMYGSVVISYRSP